MKNRTALRTLACQLSAVILLTTHLAASPAAELDPIATDLHETVVTVPMIEHGLFGDHTRDLVATTYMPDGPGPFPLIVLSHGSPPNAYDRIKVGRYRKLAQIRTFVNLGFAVIVPIRRGYGATGGSFEESNGSCGNPDFEKAGRVSAQDLLATITFADTLPQVDPNHVILVGQSAGGFASLAAASYAPKGLVAVVNFSGGRGGDPARHPAQPCAPQRMGETIAHFAATTQVPILWHYVENDMYFGPDAVKSWFSAFQAAGGRGELVYEAPFGRDGHGMFAVDRSIPIWLPHFERFVSSVVTLKPGGLANAAGASATTPQ